MLHFVLYLLPNFIFGIKQCMQAIKEKVFFLLYNLYFSIDYFYLHIHNSVFG